MLWGETHTKRSMSCPHVSFADIIEGWDDFLGNKERCMSSNQSWSVLPGSRVCPKASVLGVRAIPAPFLSLPSFTNSDCLKAFLCCSVCIFFPNTMKLCLTSRGAFFQGELSSTQIYPDQSVSNLLLAWSDRNGWYQWSWHIAPNLSWWYIQYLKTPKV